MEVYSLISTRPNCLLRCLPPSCHHFAFIFCSQSTLWYNTLFYNCVFAFSDLLFVISRCVQSSWPMIITFHYCVFDSQIPTYLKFCSLCVSILLHPCLGMDFPHANTIAIDISGRAWLWYRPTYRSTGAVLLCYPPHHIRHMVIVVPLVQSTTIEYIYRAKLVVNWPIPSPKSDLRSPLLVCVYISNNTSYPTTFLGRI